jgi:hypothetical protein
MNIITSIFIGTGLAFIFQGVLNISFWPSVVLTTLCLIIINLIRANLN